MANDTSFAIENKIIEREMFYLYDLFRRLKTSHRDTFLTTETWCFISNYSSAHIGWRWTCPVLTALMILQKKVYLQKCKYVW